MATVNSPDPKDQILPKHCVTGLFDTLEFVLPAVAALRKAGFDDAAMEIHSGPDEAARFEVDGDKQSLGTRIVRALTYALADDAGYLERTAALLRNGGAMIGVEVGENDDLAELATSVLKAHNAHDVQFWGEWLTEQL